MEISKQDRKIILLTGMNRHAGRKRTRIQRDLKTKRLSKKGRRADALALRADEGRDKLRKATGSCT